MNWYYAENGQQRGPIEEAELRALVQAGRVNNSTLVWNPNLPNWQPYEQVKLPLLPGPGPELMPPVLAAAGAVCVECGKTVSAEEAIRIRDSWVCAACKPLFLQRLAEGAALPGPGWCAEDQLLQQDYQSPTGSCVSRGWSCYRANFGPMLGTTVLIGLVLLVANGIPYLSYILGLVFNGPLIGGLWLYFVRKNRQEEALLSHAFSGFGPMFGQSLLGYLVPTILSSLPLIPGIAFLIVGLFAGMAAGVKTAFLGVAAVAVVLILVGVVASYYLTTLWLFVLPLVADKKVPFWPAMQLSRKMVAKHFWLNFGLVFCLGLIAALPIMVAAGLVVVLVAASSPGDPAPAQIAVMVGAGCLAAIWFLLCGPFALSAMACRYNDIFRNLAARP
jgi:hypothetical protein